MEAGSRIGWIDSVKGFTIILVVAHHALLGLAAANRADPTVAYWHEILLTVRMPLFFMVAGLFARKAIYGPLPRFLDTKILHFAYFYILWSMILFGIRYAANGIAYKKVELIELTYIAWDPISTIWFLYALSLAFVATRVMRKLPPAAILVIALIIQQMALALPKIPIIVILNKCDFLFFYFVIGVYGSGLIFQLAQTATTRKAMVGLTVFACFAIPLRLFNLLESPAGFFALSLIGCYACIIGIARLARSPIGKAFASVGAYSLPIYLTHFLPVAGTRFILIKLGIKQFWLLFPACIIAGVMFGIICYALALRTPAKFLFVRPSWFGIRNGAPTGGKVLPEAA